MIKTKLEAVVTDLDGTLLNDEKQIGQEDLATVAALQAQGIPVFIATGRHQSLTRCYAKELNIGYPAVTSNGALLYDFAKEEVLEAVHLTPADVLELKAFTDRHGLVYYIYTDHHCFLNLENPKSQSYELDKSLLALARPGECQLMPPDFDPTAHHVLKFMIPDCEEARWKLLRESPMGQSDRVEMVISGPEFIDINTRGISKGSAVAGLAERYGFGLENTLAIGDNGNDAAMLELVGYSVVPASAAPEIRALARHVTVSNNQNPLTHAIRALFPELLA